MEITTKPVIRAVSFEDDGGVVVDYLVPAKDAYRTGVVVNHTIRIPPSRQWDEEIFELVQAALFLLADVLEDLPGMEPIPAQLDDEDDDDDEDDED